MEIYLEELPADIKGPNDPDYKGLVPKRARFLEPEAAEAFLKLREDLFGSLIVTDIYRSPAGSLAARQSKVGVQPPGFSAHNFGLAFDAEVGAILRAMHWSYARMIDAFADRGFFCHRRDMDPVGLESWHFNYLGTTPDQYLSLSSPSLHRTWSYPVEKRIVDLYGQYFKYDAVTLQTYLKVLKFYEGELDGKIGPISRSALGAFQSAWLGYDTDNVSFQDWRDPRSQRVLAVISATKVIKPSALANV